MSLAEFYIDNGLDPSDPDHMDDYLARMRNENGFGSDEDSDDEYGPSPTIAFSGLAVVDQSHLQHSTSGDGNVLDHSMLDSIARSHGYEILDTSSSITPMASYRRHDVRLNFWLSTGTVGSYLEHPRQGKTQLFRRNVDMREAREIFENPRKHTGRGYHTTQQGR